MDGTHNNVDFDDDFMDDDMSMKTSYKNEALFPNMLGLIICLVSAVSSTRQTAFQRMHVTHRNLDCNFVSHSFPSKRVCLVACGQPYLPDIPRSRLKICKSQYAQPPIIRSPSLHLCSSALHSLAHYRLQ